MGVIRCGTKFKLVKLKGRHHTEDLGIDERTISKMDLKEQGVSMWTRFMVQDRKDYCVTLVSIRSGEFLD
jgi:hypothetical protein